MKENKNKTLLEFGIFAACLIAGMLLGRIFQQNWKSEVNSKVEEALSKVIMIDVPPMDRDVNNFLENEKYDHKYLTAIDIGDNTFGIYEIDANNEVKAYMHGKCVSTGNTKPGVYEIIDTKSHYDYHDVRYWRVVELEERKTKESLIVSSVGYEIADAPIQASEKDDLKNIMIGSEVMLTVYDNGESGTVLLVVDSKNGVRYEVD